MRTVVFGSQRIGAIWGLRNSVAPSKIVIATEPGATREIHGEKELTVVRVSDEAWRAPTFPCEQRAKDMEYELKGCRERGVKITEVYFE